jgi:WD40 repeat protein
MTLSPIGPETDQWLAIGYMGGFVSIHHLTLLETLDPEDLKSREIEFRDREQDVTDLKFAPAGNLFAVASAERTIDLYAKWFEESDDPSAAKFVLQRIGVCRGHSSAVTHMDFSDDAVYLRSWGACVLACTHTRSME